MAYQSKEEKHYRNLSEIYQIEYNNQIEVAECLMVVQGISVEMLSDCLQFANKKGGHTIESQKSYDRVKLLLSKLNLLSSIQSDNYALKLINRKNSDKIIRMQKKLIEYERIYNEQKLLLEEKLSLTPEKII